MKFKPLHANFQMPIRSTEHSAGYDIFMPEAGSLSPYKDPVKIPLGFSAAIPQGIVGIIVPRSGKGINHGLALNNTVGIIDADYRGEWVASLKVSNKVLVWEAGDRLLQFILLAYSSFEFSIVDELPETVRGSGGFGSTGN